MPKPSQAKTTDGILWDSCAVVAWNQLQFTSVSSEWIEEVSSVTKVAMDGRGEWSEVRCGRMELFYCRESMCLV